MAITIDLKKLKNEQNNIISFFNTHHKYYSQDEQFIVLSSLMYPEILSLGYSYFLAEIFSKYNIYTEGNDCYRYIAKRLEELGFLEENCCEIGAGIYPQLSALVLPTILKNNRKLTIYDPKTISNILPHAEIMNENFTEKSNIEHAGSIFGIFPCAATTVMIDKAIKENKNLLLSFCACDHSSFKIPKYNHNYWAEAVCKYYQRKFSDQFEFENYPNDLCSLPIMIRKKQKSL